MAHAQVNWCFTQQVSDVVDDSFQHIEPTMTSLKPFSVPLAEYLPFPVTHKEDFPTFPPVYSQCESQMFTHPDLEPYTRDLHYNFPQTSQLISPPVQDSGVSSGADSPASSPRSSPVPKVVHNQGQSEGGRPEESYVYMISQAILSSPDKRLVLGDIYKYILDNYPYYRTVKTAWKNCVRHNLSVNECFVRTKKAGGRGYLWAIHNVCMQSVQQGIYCRRTLNQMVFNYKKSCSTTTPVSSMVSVTSTAVDNHIPLPVTNTQPTDSAAYTSHTSPPLSAYTPMTCTVVQPGAFMTNTAIKGRMTKKQRYLAAHAECVQLLGYTLQQ